MHACKGRSHRETTQREGASMYVCDQASQTEKLEGDAAFFVRHHSCIAHKLGALNQTLLEASQRHLRPQSLSGLGSQPA